MSENQEFEQAEDPAKEWETIPDKPSDEYLLTGNNLKKKTNTDNTKKNEAVFLERSKILYVILGFICLVLVIIMIIIPLFQQDKEEDKEELSRKGSNYIPDMITRWEPEKTVETIASSFPDTEEKGELTVENETKTDDEILAGIPFSDEAKKENIAPVYTEETSSSGGSSRPETFSNEQQKAVQRMTMNTQGQIPGNNNYSYPGQSSESYGNYAQDRMNTLTDTLTGMYSNQAQGMSGNSNNTYDTQNNQTNKQAFSSQNAGNVGMQLNSEYSVYKGTIIDAVLVTGINTDLPGEVIARVTKNVYSSLYGQYLLIPAGSLLMASYNSSVSYGQDRVQVAWNTLIRPDGMEINLGNMTGIDEHGYAGYEGFVNSHPFEYLKAMGLIAAYSIVDTKIGNIANNQNNQYTENVLTDTYSAVSKLGTKILDRALDIQPTITIKQGSEIKIITNVTMELPPSGEALATQKYKRY